MSAEPETLNGRERPDAATAEDRWARLQQVERRRRQLGLIGALVLVATSLGVTIALSGNEFTQEVLERTPALRYAFLGVSLAFILYAADQNRSSRRLTEKLIEEEQQTFTLGQQVDQLHALVDAARSVNSVLAPEEVFDALLDSSVALLDATEGTVHLRVGEHLAVAASTGPDAPPRGSSRELGDDLASQAVRGRSTVIADGDRRIAAPLVVKGRAVGTFELARPESGDALGEVERATVALFAEHAATAVANASTFERERARVEALVDAAEQRADHVARTVHDLKSPLAAIAGFTQLLESEGSRPLSLDQRAKVIVGISSQVRRLEAMVADILRSSSLEAGAAMRREPIELGALIEDVRTTLAQGSQAREGAPRPISVNGTADLPTVWGDPEAIHHVLTNLVENAIKYSPPGSEVEITGQLGSGEVVVAVRDQGQGIPEDEHDSIFERFRRTSGHRGEAGVGLGLYIVRTLVQAHGGRVWVDSKPDEGATFSVALPVRRERSDSQPPTDDPQGSQT